MTIINSVIKGKQPVIDTLNVTPTTSAQQITAPQGTDGYSPVNVSAVTSSIDANIVAGNIKKDVQILGVTGSYEGTTPTGTVNITSNGTHNVANYEYAEVLVPTTAPAYYIEKTKDANNVLQNGSTVMSFSGLTGIGNYVLDHAYYSNNNITGTVDASDVTSVGTNGMQQCFYQCRNITSIDLSSLTTIGSYGCNSICRECTSLTSFDLSNLKDVGQYGIREAFYGCTGLTSVSLPALKAITASSACQNMFVGCTGITSANLSSLYVISGFSAGASMFSGCTSLTNIDISNLISMTGACGNMFQNCRLITSFEFTKLAKVSGSNIMSNMFQGCTGLTSLSFPKLAYTATNFNGALSSVLSGVTGCTVHFPAEWQTTMSSWSNVTNGFGGTNTTVLFDLPNVTTLDLSEITEIEYPSMFSNWAENNYFSNITSVNLSGLKKINASSACSAMFKNSTSITSINLSNLEIINGTQGACPSMFFGCTGITTVNLSSLAYIGYRCGLSMFQDCTGITSVNLSSLKYVGNTGLGSTFQGCTGITTLSFPALKTYWDAAVFANMLANVTGCTVHFPSNLSGAYFNVGGTNTTVLYDLPATNILTGADMKEYERNPKYDTTTALAWRVKDGGTSDAPIIDWTPYYTSGLTDPTVGTTIYSDSACTIAETTVDSIS